MAPLIVITGYVGSHTVLQLLLGGYKAVVVDNLDNSSEIAINRVQQLAREYGRNLNFHKMDLWDKTALEKLFNAEKFDAVIHFAGLKAIGEIVEKPLMYYENNLISTIVLLEVMTAYGCKNLFIEEICRDIYKSDSTWKIILLRYFNPVGEHPSGYIGENPRSISNNLMPFVQQVSVGRRPALTVFGNDYETEDGRSVRDYIHILDLVDGHIAALNKLSGPSVGCVVYNLGTGKGTSVLEMVEAFKKASGKKVPPVMAGRRLGDAQIVYASKEKAERELNWKAKYGIDEMCRDLWGWASKNPKGYESSS